MSDYIFRGVTQSNHKPSVAAYFEPRYNVNKDLQLYIGASGESISFANRAAAEIDIYGGIRPTFGAFAFDIGVWGYLYPGGTCFSAGNVLRRHRLADCSRQPRIAGLATTILPINGNVMKKNVSFFEVYGKVNYTVNDNWQFGVNEFYSPNFLNSAPGATTPRSPASTPRRARIFGTSGVGMYVSGEFGRQWFGTSDSFYGDGCSLRLPVLRTAFPSRATTPGTSASASPTRCSRSICATPTPTCRRAIATPSPATLHCDLRNHQRHRDQSGRRRLQLVRRDRHCQAVGRPDGDDQPEVSFGT